MARKTVSRKRKAAVAAAAGGLQGEQVGGGGEMYVSVPRGEGSSWLGVAVSQCPVGVGKVSVCVCGGE